MEPQRRRVGMAEAGGPNRRRPGYGLVPYTPDRQADMLWWLMRDVIGRLVRPGGNHLDQFRICSEELDPRQVCGDLRIWRSVGGGTR